MWGIITGTLSYRVGIPKDLRREDGDRETETGTRLYQGTERGSQRRDGNRAGKFTNARG